MDETSQYLICRYPVWEKPVPLGKVTAKFGGPLYEYHIVTHPLELGRGLKAGRAASDYQYIVLHIRLFQTCTRLWTAKVFPVLAEILFRRIIIHSHLVEERLYPNLVGLETEIPGIVAHN